MFKVIWIYIFVILMTGIASANEVHNINKGTDYTTIQAAIDDANTGDEIYVDSGIYYENVIVNKRLNLKGIDIGTGPIINGKRRTIIDGMRKGPSITLSYEYSIIEGFTFENSSRSDFPNNTGLLIISDNNIIKNNYAQGNEYDIFVYNSRNNTILDNDASFTLLHGIRLQNSNDNYIINNTGIYNHMAILLVRSNSNTINNNDLSYNDIGIYLLDSSDNIIEKNNASNGNRGAHLSGSSNNNILRSNNFTDNIYAMGFINLIGNGNVIYNNLFNNIDDVYQVNNITWNVTKTVNTNIIGGPNIGGNFWANPSGTGFSQTCINDGDGFCNSDYIIDSNNTDYLPLTNNPPISPDTIPPITTITRIGDYKTGDWFASPVDINLTATDDMSGVQRTEYRLSTSGSWNTYTSTFTINTEGDTPIQYHSIDNVGSIEPINSSLVRIDTISPVITVTGVTNGVIYNTNATPIINVIDTNLVSQSSTLNGVSYTSDTEISDNGNYWLNTTATDIVDHLVNSNISFTIDKSWIPVSCTGSQIYPCRIAINYNILP